MLTDQRLSLFSFAKHFATLACVLSWLQLNSQIKNALHDAIRDDFVALDDYGKHSVAWNYFMLNVSPCSLQISHWLAFSSLLWSCKNLLKTEIRSFEDGPSTVANEAFLHV